LDVFAKHQVAGIWEKIGEIAHSTELIAYTFNLNPAYINTSTGLIEIQIRHDPWTSGTASHKLRIDKIAVSTAVSSIVAALIAAIAGDVAGLDGDAMVGTDLAATAADLVTHDSNLAAHDAKLVIADALIDWIVNVLEADEYIDKTTDPYQRVIHKKGDSATEYIRKDIFDADGNNITDITTIIGKSLEP